MKIGSICINKKTREEFKILALRAEYYNEPVVILECSPEIDEESGKYICSPKIEVVDYLDFIKNYS